jgi:hypothetical protein
MAKINWAEDYYPLDAIGSGVAISEGKLSEIEDCFRLLLEQKEERVAKLSALVAKFGIELDGSKESLIALTKFLTGNISKQPGKNVMLHEWGEVCLDISVFIGEVIIKNSNSNLQWDILERHDKTDIFYHEIGITNHHDDWFPVFEFVFDFAKDTLANRLLHPILLSTNLWLMVDDFDKYR